MKTIVPIQVDASASTGSSPRLTRREFLRGTAVLTGTLAVGSKLALLAPSTLWAAEMQHLSDDQATRLVRLTQVIFPHENMPEAINALAVKDLDAMFAGGDADPAMIDEGFAKLDEAVGGDWMGAGADAQLTAVEACTDTALFGTVRSKCIVSLYDNELAYAHFGYEGAAFDKGGYLFRGFNDLAWLPEPPEAASPSAPYLLKQDGEGGGTGSGAGDRG